MASASDLRRDPEAQIVVSASFPIIPIYITQYQTLQSLIPYSSKFLDESFQQNGAPIKTTKCHNPFSKLNKNNREFRSFPRWGGPQHGSSYT